MAFGSSLPPRLPQSTGTIYYIDPAGSDSNNGQSEAAPWKTLQKAFVSLPAGSKALVKNGTYDGALNPTSSNSGTATAPKTLENYPGHSPIYRNYLRPNGLRYWRIRGLTFNAAFATRSGDTSCYLVSTTAHIEFDGCTIRDNRFGQGMECETTTSDIQWWNCLITNNGQSGTLLDHGLYIKGTNVVVANCVITNNSCFGVQMYNGGPVNCIVANNTIVNNGIRSSDTNWSGGFVLGTDSGINSCHDCKVYNNIIAFNTGWGGKSNSNVRAGANHVVQDNLIYGNTRGSTAWTSGGVTETATITQDPQFNDATNGDFTLKSTSPAINVAVEEFCPVTDRTGFTRV